MARADQDRRSWLRLGCVGVATLAGLSIVVGLILLGITYLQIRGEKPETRQAVQEVPRPSEPDPSTDDERETTPGRVILDTVLVELTVEPAPPGEPIRIDAGYDERRFELRHESEPGDGSGWTYRVGLRPKGWSNLALLRVKLGGAMPWLRIRLPRDVPLVLEGDFRQSFVAMELGGMEIETADLDVDQGWLELSFDRPLSSPMEQLSVRGDKGALSVSELGNASPRTTSLEHRVGTIRVDLRGAWLRDGDVEIESRFSGGLVRLPRDVVVEGIERARVTRPPVDPEIARPRLRISLSDRAGKLVVVDPGDAE